MSDKVLPLTLATAVVVSVDDLALGQRPEGRTLFGIGVAAIFLLGLEEISPRLATGLAALMLVGAMMTDGIKTMDALSNATKGKQ